MVWIILGLFVLAYIIADAFFEITAKLSGWWKLRARPVLRRVWGAVWGRLPTTRKSRAVEAAPAENSNSPKTSPAPAPLAENVVADQPTRQEFNVAKALANTGVFLWKAKWAILIAVIFVSGVALMRGCTPIWAKSRDTLRAELKEARITETVTAHEAGVATKAIVLAEETHRDRSRREAVIAQAEQEIEDAVSQADFDRLYLAYRRAYDGVWDDTERSDSADPAPPRGAPVRRPGADAA